MKYARLIHNQYSMKNFYLNKNSKTRLNVTWFRAVVSNPLFQRNALHTNCDTWKNCHFYTFFSNKYCMHICILTRAFENTWSFSYFHGKSFKMVRLTCFLRIQQNIPIRFRFNTFIKWKENIHNCFFLFNNIIA